jgi:hypothetical protein
VEEWVFFGVDLRVLARFFCAKFGILPPTSGYGAFSQGWQFKCLKNNQILLLGLTTAVGLLLLCRD